MTKSVSIEERFADTFDNFERTEAPFLSHIKTKLNSLPEKDRGIDDLLQIVKLECWKSNLLEKEHPVSYIKACLKNFVNRQIKARLTANGGLHYLVSTDEDGFENTRDNMELSSECGTQTALEAAAVFRIILSCLDPAELAIFKIVFWEDGGNEVLYKFFGPLKCPNGLSALGDEQLKNYKDQVRQEKCRMIKKVTRIRSLIGDGKYDDPYITKHRQRNEKKV